MRQARAIEDIADHLMMFNALQKTTTFPSEWLLVVNQTTEIHILITLVCSILLLCNTIDE